MGKGDISWKRKTPEGDKVQVYAHASGKQWRFYLRHQRFERWQPLDSPPLEDWLALLDAVERRVARRLCRPEQVAQIKQAIRNRFPEVKL